MASTHDNITPLRSRTSPAPGTPLAWYEMAEEARAVTLAAERYRARRARRRARLAWWTPLPQAAIKTGRSER